MRAKTALLLWCAFFAFSLAVATFAHAISIPAARPDPSKRLFVSPAVEAAITQMTSKMKDANLATLFSNCFPNTLDTTVTHVDYNTPDTFVITGDISAMWGRDSMNQVWPYLRFVQQDDKLATMIRGLIHRQANNVLHDPYANAFNYAATDAAYNVGAPRRVPPLTPIVWEGKYELDTLASFLRLSAGYFDATGGKDLRPFTSPEWAQAVQLVIDTVYAQMPGTVEQETGSGCVAPYQYDDQQYGVGLPGRRCGLAKSAYRPSDDNHIFPYFCPANAMMAVGLSDAARIANMIPNGAALAKSALTLAGNLNFAIQQNCVGNHDALPGPDKRVYFYEVDGFYNKVFMDDANVPSLMALPLLGFLNRTDIVYRNTRQLLLSPYTNPYFYSGLAGTGIGSFHTRPGNIWPIALIVQAMTSDDPDEVSQLLQTLLNSADGTGFMHESYWKDDPHNYTRSWFAWANGLFGELIFDIADRFPNIIFRSGSLHLERNND